MRQDILPAQPDLPSLRTLQAAIFYMMSHYSAHPCPCLARAIVDHLRVFAGHPGNANCPVMRDICEKLSRYWQREGGRAASHGEPDASLVH